MNDLPRTLSIIVNDSCPLRCRHCSLGYDEKHSGAKSAMSEDDLAALIRSTPRETFEIITFVGGEPTVVPEFLPLLRATKKLGYKTLLITNGAKMAERKFARQAMPLLDEMVLSIHGHTPELHDKLVKEEGSFEELKRVFELLGRAKSKPFVITNTVVLQQNIEFIPDIVHAEYVGSMFTVRTVLPHVDATDERPTVVEQVGERVITVFSGKVGTCVDAAERVVRIVAQESQPKRPALVTAS